MKIFVPDGQRMLITAYKAATESKSGLIMDNSTNNNAATVLGTVVRLGDEKFNDKPVPWEIDDEVMFRRYSVDSLKIITDEGEKEYNLCDYADIVGHFKKE
jgi:co-chaperonin GroES (HSP10)